jgi:hypothetical protein
MGIMSTPSIDLYIGRASVLQSCTNALQAKLTALCRIHDSLDQIGVRAPLDENGLVLTNEPFRRSGRYK